MNRNNPVEQISVAKKPERQIPKGHGFSIKKTSFVHEKTMTPRSCLRWKPTGKNFKTVGLRWIPTGKIFKSSTTKVDNEPPHGTSINVQEEQNLDLSAGLISWTNFITRYNIYTVKQSLRSRRYKRRSCNLILVESDSLPHAHAQATKTYYKHQDSRIKKAQELKTKTFANSNIRELSRRCKSNEARFKISPQEFKDHTLGEIVSLKYVYEHGSSESAGSLVLREIVSLKILSQTRKLGYES
ncbi:hypothetical protein Tco_1359705 [Tanacetum coccineum]